MKRYIITIILYLVLLLSSTPSYAAFSVIVTDSTGAPVAAPNSATSSSLNTTGGNLAVVVASWFSGITGTITVTDNKSNSWNQLTTSVANSYSVQIWWSALSSVGTGHTFTVTGTSTFPVISVVVVSGAHSSPFDLESGATSTNVESIQAGSITPTQNNSLVIAGVMNNIASDLAINSSYTADVTNKNADSVAGGIAYIIQSSATATNPTWSWSSSDFASAVIASFKVATDVAGRLSLLGVGR